MSEADELTLSLLMLIIRIGQGARSDLNAVKDLIKSGSTELSIADEHFAAWCKHYKAFTRYRNLITLPRSFQTQLLVYWGPSDSGKSSHAFDLGGNDAFWLSKPRSGSSGAWWDGYESNKTVIIDEFYGWLPRDLVQRIIDRYPLNVETKGGVITFQAERVIITSNHPPSMWWRKIGLGAMKRRLEWPIGFVFYVGDDTYPDEESYLKSLEVPAAAAGEAAVPGFL